MAPPPGSWRSPSQRALLIVAGYFVLAVIANAVAWAGLFDDRALEYRRWDYGWELLLPWEAREGRWSGRDFIYPIGPLWQLIAWLPNAFGDFSPARAIGGLHLIFPLLSLLAVWLTVRAAIEQPGLCAVAFAGLALLALHDDVRSFRSVLPLAVLVAYAHDGERAGWRRAVVVGVLVAACTALSFDTGILAAVAVIVMAAFRALSERFSRASRDDALRVLGAVFGAQLVLALLLVLTGGSYLALLRGVVDVVGAYTAAMVIGAHGFTPRNVITFVALALLLWGWLAFSKARDPLSASWLVGAMPFAFRGVLRSDAEHVYAGLMPLVAVVWLVALRSAARGRRFIAGYAGLLSVIFVLGWFGGHRDRPEAWSPRAFLRAARVMSGGAASEREYAGDFARIRRFLTDAKAEGAACVVLPPSAVALHAAVGIHGPTEMALGWSAPMLAQMAAQVRRDRCPYALQELVSFDGASSGFGDYLLAMHELYEPVDVIGPDLVVSRIRAGLEPARRRPLALMAGSSSIDVPGSVSYRFERRVPWHHALSISYRFEVPWLRRVLGATPRLEVQFFDGAEPIAPPILLSYVTPGSASLIVPVHAEVAEQRWVLSRTSAIERAADRMVISTRGSALSPAQIEFQIDQAAELIPSRPPASSAARCNERIDLLDLGQKRAYFRAASPAVAGDALVLEPNLYPEPDAELFVALRPCENSCLFAELGVDAPLGQGDGVDFEAHVLDVHERARLLAWHADAGVSPKPAELPLGRWAGRDVLVRFGVRSGKTRDHDRARIYRPRIAPCATLQNLVVALHSGELSVLRGHAEARGDTLRMEPGPLFSPPNEVRLPVHVPERACLAVNAWSEGPPTPIGVYVGVVDGDLAVRLARPELGSNEPPIYTEDLSLERFTGKNVELRFASYVLSDGPRPTAVISAPRIHRCGDGAAWGFGKP